MITLQHLNTVLEHKKNRDDYCHTEENFRVNMIKTTKGYEGVSLNLNDKWCVEHLLIFLIVLIMLKILFTCIE